MEPSAQLPPVPPQAPAGTPLPTPVSAPNSSVPPVIPGQALPAAKPATQQPTITTQPANKRTQNSAQNSLLIGELRDNFVIMNDGSMRAVVACHSINFDLMSEREREAIEYSYQNFLNSLYFPIQIAIRSQKVDIGPYLDRLAKLRSNQDNMLLGVLMDDYMDFVANIAQQTNIMDKTFYIAIPYFFFVDPDNTLATSKNLLLALFAPPTQKRVHIDESTFEKAKDELRNRVQTVISGLMQIGIRSTQLSTKELGELYYNMYNPDTAVRQPLGNLNNLTAPIITKGTGTPPNAASQEIV